METRATALHSLLAQRFSPSRFDAAHHLDDPSVTVLLDAARWAPSAGNSQPTGLLVARRGDATHQRIVPHVAPSSRTWAVDASALVVTAARLWVDESIAYSEFADYDLGQAVAHLTIQAEAMELSCHQFRAFDLDALTVELQPDYGWVIRTIVAVGRAAEPRPSTRSRRTTTVLTSQPWATM